MPSTRYTPDPDSPQGVTGTCQQRVFRWLHQTPRITKFAQVGTGLWFVLGFLGPLFMAVPCLTPTGGTPTYLPVTATALSLVLFLIPFWLTITGPTNPETWGVRQRIMLWQAAAGGAFLAIDWSDTKGDNKEAILSTAGLIATMWVLGGAMGMWLEPAKSQGKKASRH